MGHGASKLGYFLSFFYLVAIAVSCHVASDFLNNYCKWSSFILSKLAFHSDSAWSLAFLVSCTSAGLCLMSLTMLYRDCFETVLIVTHGSYLVLQSPTNYARHLC